MLPITAACGVCSLDGWLQQIQLPVQKTARETPSSLMECSVCFEIVHPECLLKDVNIYLLLYHHKYFHCLLIIIIILNHFVFILASYLSVKWYF